MVLHDRGVRSLNNQVIMLFWITGNNAYCCFEKVFPIPLHTFLQFVDYRYRHALREKSNMGTVYCVFVSTNCVEFSHLPALACATNAVKATAKT